MRPAIPNPHTVSPSWRLSATAETTARLGAAIAPRLRIGEAVCLQGPLGAGKSTLARSLIRALTRPDEDVPSPTFTLVQFYSAAGLSVAHFDLYRLTRPEEAYEIGLEEALETGAAVIEWPERLEGLIPADRLDVELRLPPEPENEIATSRRLVRLTGHGAWEARAGALELGFSFD